MSDNASWSPTLSASWVWVENGVSKNVILQVRIPDNAVAYTMDNIRVIARSKYRNYDNTIVENENSCVVNVIPVSGIGVKLTISPW